MLSTLIVTASLALGGGLPPGTLVAALDCDGCVASELAQVGDGGSRELELRREIDDLDARIAAIDTAWPTSAVVMATAGYIMTPFLLLGTPLLLAGLLIEGPLIGLIVAGGLLTAIGVAGLVLLIKGVIDGVEGSKAATSERDALRDRRRRLHLELQELKRTGSMGGGVSLPVWVARF